MFFAVSRQHENFQTTKTFSHQSTNTFYTTTFDKYGLQIVFHVFTLRISSGVSSARHSLLLPKQMAVFPFLWDKYSLGRQWKLTSIQVHYQLIYQKSTKLYSSVLMGILGLFWFSSSLSSTSLLPTFLYPSAKCTVVSYQNESFSSKWELPCLPPSSLELWRKERASRQLSFWWKTLILIGHYGI